MLVAFTIFAATLLTYLHLPRHAGLDLWRQWDTGWYLDIARSGYFTPQAAAFFPLYPALVHVAGGSLAAALAIANLGTLAGLVGVGLLAERESGSGGPPAVLRMTLAYPFAFFLAAAYTEGLFLALAAFALLWARQGRWWSAGAAAFLAALTRNTGIVLVLPLAWEYGRQTGWMAALRRPATLLGWAGTVLGAPLGLGVYVLYLWRRFGDPLLYVHVQPRYWGRETWPIWQTIGEALRRLFHNHGGLLPLDLGVFLLFAAITIAAARRLPFAFTLYMAGLLFVSIALPRPAEQDLLASTGRFLTLSIPVFLVLGRWIESRPALDLLLTAGGLVLQAGLLLTFFAGGPVY